jgi:hypothetical protein
MEPIRTELKAFKAKLNNIVITKGEMYWHESDYIDPDEVGPSFIEIEGFVLNHEFNKVICYNTFKEEFLNVRNEFEYNSRSIVFKEFKIYLNEIVETYNHFEEKIIEDEDGSLSTDIVKFEECDLNTIKGHIICNYDQFLMGLKHQFRDEIIYLKGFINSTENTVERKFKRIRIKTKVNVLGTLFYDLLEKHYIETSKANLIDFIYESFADENGEAIKKSTTDTILKPEREDKRANTIDRIIVPDF